MGAISLNSIIATQLKKTPTKTKKSDRPGVYGTLPRIGIPDHEFEFVIIQGLRPISASAAVKLIHRLDIEDRLPRLCASAGRARRPASNHLHVLFPGCVCYRQLEATKLYVLSSHILCSSHSVFSVLFFFPLFSCLGASITSLFFFLVFLDPVLFASSCGEVGTNPPSTTTATLRNEAAHDLRLSSISAAVEFSKNNNLLGVFLDTYLLV